MDREQSVEELPVNTYPTKSTESIGTASQNSSTSIVSDVSLPTGFKDTAGTVDETDSEGWKVKSNPSVILRDDGDDIAVIQEDAVIAVSREDSGISVNLDDSPTVVIKKDSSIVVVKRGSSSSVIQSDSRTSVNKQDSSVAVSPKNSGLAVIQEDSGIVVTHEDEASSLIQEKKTLGLTEEVPKNDSVEEKSKIVDLNITDGESTTLFCKDIRNIKEKPKPQLKIQVGLPPDVPQKTEKKGTNPVPCPPEPHVFEITVIDIEEPTRREEKEEAEYDVEDESSVAELSDEDKTVESKSEVSVVTLLKPKSKSTKHVPPVETVNTQTSTSPFSFGDIVTCHINLGQHAELVEDLIYWRTPRRTAAVFLSALALLLSMQFYSLISVFSYISLIVLVVGLVGRAYCSSQNCEHPVVTFCPSLSEDNVRSFIDVTAFYVNDTILKLRHLYLAEDVGDSVKCGLVLWYLSYVGSWFNGMTIVTMSFITVFTLPMVYERNKAVIDSKMAVLRDRWLELAQHARVLSTSSFERFSTHIGLHEKDL